MIFNYRITFAAAVFLLSVALSESQSSSFENHTPKQWCLGSTAQFHMPLSAHEKLFDAYRTYGIIAIFPTYNSAISLSSQMQFGSLQSLYHNVLSPKLLFASLSTRWYTSEPCDLSPFLGIGISNTALHVNQKNTVRDAVLIATWESEFGFLGELGVRWKKSRFVVESSITANRVMSLPERFDTFGGAISVGFELPFFFKKFN